MKVYSDAEAGRDLNSLLEQARRDGEVRIRRPDGWSFVVRPEPGSSSPLDVEGVDTNLSSEEIVGFIREGRRHFDPT